MNNQLIVLLYLKGMSKEALVEHIKRDNFSAFKLACYKGHLEIANFLLEQGFVKEQIKAWDYWAFRFACKKGHLEIAKFLLEQGFVKEQIEASAYWAFRYACENGQLEMAKFLLEQGFVEEQIKVLRKYENSDFKIKYKDLVEKGIV